MSQKIYFEYRIFLIGEPKVGKKSIINKINNSPCTQTIKYQKKKEKKKNSKSKDKFKIKNMKIKDNNLENKTDEKKEEKNEEKNKNNIVKLYNILKFKITLISYYIKPAIPIPIDYDNDEQDSDYEIESNQKIILKDIKKSIKENLYSTELKIDEHSLKDYQIIIRNLFFFVFDLSNYSSFEYLISYFNSLNKYFSFNNEENNISCILIGNKLDKKIIFDQEQQNDLNNFIKKFQIPYYEISTRIFFPFEKIFEKILLENLSQIESSFKKEHIIQNMKQIFENKSTFNKASKSTKDINEEFPGPKYNINIFGYDSENELNNALSNKKLRFKTKIFVNKIGPIINRNKSEINVVKSVIDNDKFIPHFSNDKDNYYKSNKGFSFTGPDKNSNHLSTERKEMRIKRNKEFISSFNDKNIFDLMNDNEKNFHDEKYFEEIKKRRFEYQEKKINDYKQKLEKILKINKDNLEKIKEQKEKEKENILDNNKKIIKSKSLPDILDDTIKNENVKKESFYNILYLNNKKHLKNLKKVIKTQSYSPGPNSYDTRGDLLNLNKGKTLIGKRKYSLNNKNDVPFTNFKSSFDIIVEKKNNIKRPFNERFPQVTKEPILKEKYNDETIWKKWELNKKKTKNLKFEIFKKEREDFLNKHKELSKKIKERKFEKIQKIKNYLKKKGQSIGNNYDSIIYNQIEERSPSYSILGRHYVKEKSDDDEKDLINENNETLIEKNKTLYPNYFIGKDNYPSFSFTKSERFPRQKVEYYNTRISNLFENGNYSLKDKEDFSSKEPYSFNDERGNYTIDNHFPGPGYYNIKSQFEKIIEDGKEKNDNRIRLMLKDNKYVNFS